VWGAVTAAVRQRAVPDRLRGRVNSVCYLFIVGGAALGALQGGLLAKAFGITAPYWLAFAVMAAFTPVAWRLLGRASA
jgi:MFS family permease